MYTQRTWATGLCEELLPLDTACCRSSCSRSVLPRHWRSEMTHCVVQLVSSTGCPSLITTQELLLRCVFFAVQSLSAHTPRHSSLVPSGNDHATCGLFTRYRTTRRARATGPHVARVISLMKILTGYCKSVLSVARCPNTPTRL